MNTLLFVPFLLKSLSQYEITMMIYRLSVTTNDFCKSIIVHELCNIIFESSVNIPYRNITFFRRK